MAFLGVKPRDGESLIGYIARLAGRRLEISTPIFARNLGFGSLTNRPTRHQLQTICTNAEIELEAGLSMTLGYADDPKVTFHGIELPKRFSERGEFGPRRICPLCSMEDDFHRLIWDVAYVSACPIHRVALQDTCPRCERQLSWGGRWPRRCDCASGAGNIRAAAMTDVEATASAALHGLLGERAFAADAARISALPPFGMLPSGDIVELTLILGSLHTRVAQRGFTLEGVSQREGHYLMAAGSEVAQHWPDAFFPLLDRLMEENAARSMPRQAVLKHVSMWRMKLSAGARQGPFRDAVEQWCRMRPHPNAVRRLAGQGRMDV